MNSNPPSDPHDETQVPDSIDLPSGGTGPFSNGPRPCESFREQWLAGEAPRIEDYLEGVAVSERSQTLESLLAVELELRRHQGDQPEMEQYTARLPRDREVVERVFRLRVDINETAPLGSQTDPGSFHKQDLHSPTGTAASSEPWPTIAGYEIRGPLGAGGMGTVWRALQLSTRRMVALKLMGTRIFGSQKARLRFEREVELSARLDHPHIARVYESGECEGQCYYALQLIEGEHLDQFVRAGKLDRTAVLALMQQVASAVQHAHQRGVIHRDLKPSNILVDSQGQPHILDFGLAKAILQDDQSDHHESLTSAGEVTGTLAFMAPEQAAGRVDQIDTRTDVYTLGVILYRLLTDSSPHDLEGSQFDLIRRIVEEDVIRPRAVDASIDGELEAVLLKSLEKQPADRYASAGDLAADLKNLEQGEPISAHPPSSWYFLRKRLAKHKVAIATTVTLMVLGVSLLVIALMRERELRIASLTAEQQAQQALQQVRKSERESRQRLVSAYVERGWQAFEADDHSGAALLHAEALRIDEQSPQDDKSQQDQKRLADHRLRISQGLQFASRVPLLLEHPAAVEVAQFSHDGALIISGSTDGTVRVWNAQTGVPQSARWKHDGRVTWVGFSQDGRFAASAGDDRTARVVDLQDGNSAPRILTHAAEVDDANFSSTENRLATGADGKVYVWDFATGEQVAEPFDYSSNSKYLRKVGFSPNGKLLAGAGTSPFVTLWDAETVEKKHPPINPGTSGMMDFEFSRDGSRLAVCGMYGNARVIDTQSGQLLGADMFHRRGSWIAAVSFSPDGARLATAGGLDNSARVWNVATGEPVTKAIALSGEAVDVAFAPDGGSIATAAADGSVQIWNALTGEPQSPVLPHNGRVHQIHFGPSGRRLLTASDDGLARVWRLQFEPAVAFEVQTGRGKSGVAWWEGQSRFDPRGKQLVAFDPFRDPRLWKFSSPQDEPIVLEHPRPTNLETLDVRYSPTGERLLVLISSWQQSPYGTGYLWDVRSEPKLIRKLEHPKNIHTERFAYLPDGSQVATAASDGIVRLFDTTDGHLIAATPAAEVSAVQVAYHPDGKHLLALYENDQARIYDAQTAQPRSPYFTYGDSRENRSYYRELAFSSDGSYFATTSEQGTLKVWKFPDAGNVQGQELLAVPESMPVPVLDGTPTMQVRFRPGHQQLAIASEVGRIRSFDVETGKPVGPPLKFSSYSSFEFTADGGRLLIASGIWDADTMQRIVPQREHPHPGEYAGTNRFSRDGGWLAANSNLGEVVVWSIASLDWPLADLQALTELAAVRRVDKTGALVALTKTELMGRSARLRRLHPKYFQATD